MQREKSYYGNKILPYKVTNSGYASGKMNITVTGFSSYSSFTCNSWVAEKCLGRKTNFYFLYLNFYSLYLKFFLIFICGFFCLSLSSVIALFGTVFYLLVVTSFVSDSFSRLHLAFSVLDSSNFHVNSPSIFTGFEPESQRIDDSHYEVFTTQPSKPVIDTSQMALINQDITMSIEAYRRSPKC